MPLTGHGLRPPPLRRRVGRPQLKRDPLGGGSAFHETVRDMTHRLRLFGLCLLVALYAACSGSTNPVPTIAGTWHVVVLSVDSGTLTPSRFNLVITAASDSTFTVAMPAIVWSRGPVRYDTLAHITSFQGDSPDSTLSFEEWCTSLKCALTFHANMNQARDTLTSIALLFSDTTNIYVGPDHVVPILWMAGRFIAYK